MSESGDAVVLVVVIVGDGEGSLVVAQPLPPLGTRLTAGSLLLCSLFKLGKLAGGRRADGTFPKLCIPCLRGNVLFCRCCSKDSPYNVTEIIVPSIYIFSTFEYVGHA